jgi:hypothetical protein
VSTPLWRSPRLLLAGGGLIGVIGWAGLSDFMQGSPVIEVAPAVADVESFGQCRTGRSFYVSPDGNAQNDGSQERPLDLTTALSAASPARPCDTIWLRGGTYKGTYVSDLKGSESQPIVVRQLQGERAIIDSAPSNSSALTANGTHTWFWGFEITSTDPDRSSDEVSGWPSDLRRGSGVTTSQGTYLKFINLIVHDLARGFEIGSASIGTEVYGSLIYHNGWTGPKQAPVGHGIDTHNRVGRRRIADNIIFGQFSHGVIALGSDQEPSDNISLEGNIIFNNDERDVLIGGSVARNPILGANMTYGGGQVNVGYGQGCSEARIEDNYLAASVPLVLGCEASLKNNTLYGTVGTLPTTYPDNVYPPSRPTGLVVHVRPNEYEPGRAHVAVYNWDKQPTVGIDLSSSGLAVGETFEVKDAQNFFGPPILTGTLPSNRIISVSLTGLSSVGRLGDDRPRTHTAPDFAALVVTKVGR